MRWELLTADRKVVAWDGQDAEDAARRFVDSERVAGRVSVVVWPPGAPPARAP